MMCGSIAYLSGLCFLGSESPPERGGGWNQGTAGMYNCEGE